MTSDDILNMNDATLRAKLATLAAENSKLKRVAKHTRADSQLSRARKDALQLLAWRFSGFAISRKLCMERGMTQRRWVWARALLHHARVLSGHDVAIVDFNGAVAALESSVKFLEGSGLESLRLRLPQHVRASNRRPNYRYRAARGSARGAERGADAGAANGADAGTVKKCAATPEKKKRGMGESGRKRERNWKIDGGNT